jgi:branched-chain amino acid transport system substrate-binding protein
VGGKGVDGALVSAGPLMVAEQLPDSHPSKAAAVKFVQAYEKQFGAGSRTTLAGHSYDIYLMLEQVVPVALKKAKPGTPEFRAALKDAFEAQQATAVSNGVLDYSPTDHWGFRPDAGVIMKVVGGDWKLDL